MRERIDGSELDTVAAAVVTLAVTRINTDVRYQVRRDVRNRATPQHNVARLQQVHRRWRIPHRVAMNGKTANQKVALHQVN